MGERFGLLRALLPVVAGIFGGRSYGWQEVAEATGLQEGQARRIWRVLVEALELDEHQDGNRKVAALRSSPAPITPDLEGLVAIAFADQLMTVFKDTEIHQRWRALADQAHQSAGPRARATFEKLGNGLVFLPGPRTVLSPVRNTISEVLDALLTHHHLAIRYGSAAAARDEVVEPWSLVLSSGSLYLLGRRRDEDRARLWKLERIQRCGRLRDAPFEPPSRFRFDGARFFDDAFGVWVHEGDEPCEVRLRFTGGIAEYVADTTWHRTERKQTHPDGTVELRLMVTHNPELERWILGFGEACEVLAPEELRASIRDRHAAAARRYA